MPDPLPLAPLPLVTSTVVKEVVDPVAETKVVFTEHRKTPPVEEKKEEPPLPSAAEAFLSWLIRNNAKITIPETSVQFKLNIAETTVTDLFQQMQEIVERSDLGPVHN